MWSPQGEPGQQGADGAAGPRVSCVPSGYPSGIQGWFLQKPLSPQKPQRSRGAPDTGSLFFYNSLVFTSFLISQYMLLVKRSNMGLCKQEPHLPSLPSSMPALQDSSWHIQPKTLDLSHMALCYPCWGLLPLPPAPCRGLSLSLGAQPPQLAPRSQIFCNQALSTHIQADPALCSVASNNPGGQFPPSETGSQPAAWIAGGLGLD